MGEKSLDLLFTTCIWFASYCRIPHQKHCFTTPHSGIFNVQFMREALVGMPATTAPLPPDKNAA